MQTLGLANLVDCPHSKISMRMLSLGLHKFNEMKTYGRQRTPDVAFWLMLISVLGLKNSYC